MGKSLPVDSGEHCLASKGVEGLQFRNFTAFLGGFGRGGGECSRGMLMSPIYIYIYRSLCFPTVL